MSLYSAKISEFLPRLGLAIVFAYFGINAIIDPAGQGAAWVQAPIEAIIVNFISVETFMILFGILQTALAVAALVKILPKYTFSIMSLLLIGIIVNLSISFGFGNDVVIRDIALLTMASSLAIKHWSKS